MVSESAPERSNEAEPEITFSPSGSAKTKTGEDINKIIASKGKSLVGPDFIDALFLILAGMKTFTNSTVTK